MKTGARPIKDKNLLKSYTIKLIKDMGEKKGSLRHSIAEGRKSSASKKIPVRDVNRDLGGVDGPGKY